MSVTFSVDAPVTEWVVSCSCGAARSEVFASYIAAEVSRDFDEIIACGDEYCDFDSHNFVVAVNDFNDSVNVSNVNARFILGSMGVQNDDLMGSMSGEAFLGFVLMCQGAGVSDAGVPSTVDSSVVDCGRREGYLDDVLVQLEGVALAARESGFPVMWS